MHELLSFLELKVKELINDRKSIGHERDLLAQKVIELQEKIDNLEEELSTVKIDCESKEQDVMLASMVVEDLLEELDNNSDKCNLKEYQSALEKQFEETLDEGLLTKNCILIQNDDSIEIISSDDSKLEDEIEDEILLCDSAADSIEGNINSKELK